MFPIRDHNPSTRVPYVTYSLIAINIAVFLWGLVAHQTNADLIAFYDAYAMIPAKVSQGTGYTGLITSMFLHGGFMHIAGNMLFLFIYGDNVEDEMGHVPFLLFYLVAGLLATYAQYAFDPQSTIPLVGASGAIAGVMGSYLLLFPKAKVDVFIFLIVIIRIIPIPAWILLGLWFAMQLTNGFASDMTGGGVAYWAHAGGFVAGAVMTLPLWLRLGGQRFWKRTHGMPPHPEARYRYGESAVPRVRRKK